MITIVPMGEGKTPVSLVVEIGEREEPPREAALLLLELARLLRISIGDNRSLPTVAIIMDLRNLDHCIVRRLEGGIEVFRATIAGESRTIDMLSKYLQHCAMRGDILSLPLREILKALERAEFPMEGEALAEEFEYT